MLSKNQISQLKQQLLTEQHKLQQEAVQALDSSATVQLDQQSVGRLSRMDALQAQAMAQELARRRTRQLLEIAAALKRIDTGEYGFCEDCDESINAARLHINPACRFCLNCADNH
ncbi:TraR/DksA family transcriptional regulator [Alishewanella agri BL06]|uniref:TraR/DksA family transcriptional regulator n=1 Tax=Alishewanella agri BL06 TaxID=1195246 RepID=I8U6B6_9ALTE|nr:TraR/DksA C4-type zinc finger protein [Alishewanella agri]EIW88856.1 TraR/DksA family transcriptional regulator [Alishewanella agri BL06]